MSEDKDLISESEAAVISGLTIFQLRKRRQTKKPPAYHKVDGRVLYERSVMKDLNPHRVKSKASTIFDHTLPERDKIKQLSIW